MSALAIETLLDLHDQIIDQGDGYWIKIEAWKTDPTSAIPHGVRYSMTLHEPYGKRILGYDNAHAVKPPKKLKHAGRERVLAIARGAYKPKSGEPKIWFTSMKSLAEVLNAGG